MSTFLTVLFTFLLTMIAMLAIANWAMSKLVRELRALRLDLEYLVRTRTLTPPSQMSYRLNYADPPGLYPVATGQLRSPSGIDYLIFPACETCGGTAGHHAPDCPNHPKEPA